MDKGIKVSIITPSYNCEEFIGSTIESIQRQSYKNWELLITDDCSSDNSREIIRKYAEADSRIRLFELDKNSGAGVSRNNSIMKATGRFIAFCDSDDRWYPDKLELQLRFILEKNCGLCYSSYDTCDENGNVIGSVKCLPMLNFLRILRGNGVGCLTAIYDSEKIGKQYMPTIRKRQDWCLWIRIIREYGKAYGIDRPLALYRIRKGSISSRKIEMLKYNFMVYHGYLGYNKVKSAVLLGFYFLPYYFYSKLKQKLYYRKRKSGNEINKRK